MEKQYDKIIDKYVPEFDNWVNIINSYTKNLFSLEKCSDPDFENKTHDVVALYSKLLTIFSKTSQIKDKWENPTFFLNPFGFQTQIKSCKTCISIEMGIDNKGIYMESFINNAENIKNMGDEFWLSFLELSKIGVFEFIENGKFSSLITVKYPHLFRTFKGNLYKIMRNYFLLEYLQKDKDGLGSLKMRWDSTYSFEDIFTNAFITFKEFYKFNYSLWKINDLKKYKK
jgi:hypothetical protein